MATWTDVSKILRGIRGVERAAGTREWRVKKKLAAWQRPLRKADLEALGDAAPKGDILGVYAPLDVKDALVAAGGPYFTTPHFDGWPAVLVVLGKIRGPALKKLLASACAARAER